MPCIPRARRDPIGLGSRLEDERYHVDCHHPDRHQYSGYRHRGRVALRHAFEGQGKRWRQHGQPGGYVRPWMDERAVQCDTR